MLHRFMSRAAAFAAVLCAFNAVTASAQAVTAVEYYNKAIDAYFLTARANEQVALDGVADFQRTGMTFQAVAAASATAAQPGFAASTSRRPRPTPARIFMVARAQTVNFC